MLEIHLRQAGLLTVLAKYLLKKNMKSSKKNEIQNVITKMKLIKVTFNMTWLMEIFKIYLEKQLQIKYYVINHLILQKILKMMDIISDLLE